MILWWGPFFFHGLVVGPTYHPLVQDSRSGASLEKNSPDRNSYSIVTASVIISLTVSGWGWYLISLNSRQVKWLCIPSSWLMSLLKKVRLGIRLHFISQKIEEKEAEKKISSTMVKAMRHSTNVEASQKSNEGPSWPCTWCKELFWWHQRGNCIRQWRAWYLLWGEKRKCKQVWNNPKTHKHQHQIYTNPKTQITCSNCVRGDSGVCTEYISTGDWIS